MKYYVFFHCVDGRDIRMTTMRDADFDLEKAMDDTANGLARCPFIHFMDDGKLVIVNMANVAYIKITKAE